MGEAQGIRTVIADNHYIFRVGTRKLLESEGGFSIVGEATNGFEAIELAKNLRPDVLLLDFSMPQLTGLEVLAQLAKTPAAAHTLLLTASIDKSEAIEALLLGAQGIVLKHSPSEMLLKSIRAVIRGELWISREMVADLVKMLRGTESTPIKGSSSISA